MDSTGAALPHAEHDDGTLQRSGATRPEAHVGPDETTTKAIRIIRRFTIHGFKRFERKTVVDLDDVTVLVGANNNGKSTVLLALTLFQEV